MAISGLIDCKIAGTCEALLLSPPQTSCNRKIDLREYLHDA